MTLIQPEGLRVSRLGVNVESPPALTEDYLAIDWTWPRIERLHARARVLGSSLPGGALSFTYPFASLPVPPLATVIPMDPGTTQHRDEMITSRGTSSSDGVLYFSWGSAFSHRTTVNTLTVLSLGGLPLTQFDWAVFIYKP